MRTLIIETAAGACSVALADDGVLIADIHEDVGRGHAERLIPMISELPVRGKADRILVDCGPGSFTGVRVGIAAARGLGLGWGVPVSGFSALTLIAANADWADEETLAVATHGGHGQYFIQRFAKDGVRPVTDIASLIPEDAVRAVPDALVIGSAAADLVALRGHGDARLGLLAARGALALAADHLTPGAAPLYGRAPDAKPMPIKNGG